MSNRHTAAVVNTAPTHAVSTKRAHLSLAGICLLLAMAALPLDANASSTLTLMWEPSPNSAVVGYVVYVRPASATSVQAYDTAGATSFVYTQAVAGQQYCFAVASYAAGPSIGAPTAEVCGFSNAPPVLTNPGSQTGVRGVATTLQLAGTDPDGRPVSYAAAGLPPGLTLMASTGLVSGVPQTAGSFAVTAAVSDGVLSHSVGFTWSITEPGGAEALKPGKGIGRNK